MLFQASLSNHFQALATRLSSSGPNCAEPFQLSIQKVHLPVTSTPRPSFLPVASPWRSSGTSSLPGHDIHQSYILHLHQGSPDSSSSRWIPGRRSPSASPGWRFPGSGAGSHNGHVHRSNGFIGLSFHHGDGQSGIFVRSRVFPRHSQLEPPADRKPGSRFFISKRNRAARIISGRR